MMPSVSLPNVDAMLLNFLSARITPPVHITVPDPRPETFVRAWRTGGGPLNRAVEQALVTVQAWAPTNLTAHALAAACRDVLLNDNTGMPLVRNVEVVSGPYLDPDPDSRHPRYTVTARLTVRGHR